MRIDFVSRNGSWRASRRKPDVCACFHVGLTPRRSPRRTRNAFTLLEVLLASAIAVLLMGALYVSMQVELRQAAEGREVIERATLSRAIINRLSLDLTPCLTPPKAKGKTSGSTSASTSTTTASTSTTTDTSAAGADATAMVAEQVTSAVPLQAGVIGDGSKLIIYTTRVPDPKYMAAEEGSDAPVPGDLRRVAYWIGENGGLCREEVPWVTGEQVYGSKDPIIESGNEDEYVIAREVTSVMFEYYDINATNDNEGWTASWDGSELGPDGKTPKGPPSAIRVRFELQMTDAAGDVTKHASSHVIPIITSSGPSIVIMESETSDGNSTTPSMQ